MLNGPVRRRGAQGPRRGRPAGRRAVPEVPHRERHRGRRRHRHLRGRRHRPPRPVPPGRGVHRADAGAAQSPPGHRGAPPPRRAGDAHRHQAQHRQAEVSFAERLEELMRKYTNQNLTAAQIIAELVALAKEVSADANRGAQLRPAAQHRRTRLLRRGRPERVRRHRDGHQRPGRHRPRPGPHPAPRRHHRLGSPRRRPRQDPLHHQAPAGQVRLPPGRARPTRSSCVLDQMETFADDWSPEASAKR